MIVPHEEHERTDGIGTYGNEPAGDEPERSSRRWAASAADISAGSGPYLGADPGQAGLQRCVYRPLGQAVWAGTAGGAFQSPCRGWPEQADAGLGGADAGLDAEAEACRRVDALEHAQAGFGADDLVHAGG